MEVEAGIEEKVVAAVNDDDAALILGEAVVMLTTGDT